MASRLPSEQTNLQQQALEHIRKREYADAKRILEGIIRDYGDFERGAIHQSLGNCYEDLGEFAKAREAYLAALRQEPGNPYFVDTYAAFLRHHGSMQEFYEWELASVQLTLENGGVVTAERRANLVRAGEGIGEAPERTTARMSEQFVPPGL
ncbi:MAG: tetratricopeptide repeat protein [Rhizomicrobium sp.]